MENNQNDPGLAYQGLSVNQTNEKRPDSRMERRQNVKSPAQSRAQNNQSQAQNMFQSRAISRGLNRDNNRQSVAGDKQQNSIKALNGEIDSPEKIQKRRQEEKMRIQLQDYFKQLDKDHNSSINKAELLAEAHRRYKIPDNDQNRRDEIQKAVDQVFKDIDQDGDQDIEFDEFVGFYHMKVIEAQNDISSLKENIEDQQMRLDEIVNRLKEIEQSEQPSGYRHPSRDTHNPGEKRPIMIGSALTVHLVDVRGLGTLKNGAIPRIRVKLSTENKEDARLNQESQTNESKQQTANPIFNEVINFDIQSGLEDIKIQIFEVSQGPTKRVLLAENKISLDVLKAQDLPTKGKDGQPKKDIDQVKIDSLYDLRVIDNNDVSNRLLDDEAKPQVRMSLQWIYSKVWLLMDMAEQINDQKEENQANLVKREAELEKFQNPVEFLFQAIEQQQEKNLIAQADKIMEVKEYEKKWSKDVDEFFFQRDMNPRWGRWTMSLTIVMLIVTVLVCFYKADFLNLTVSCLAIQILINADTWTAKNDLKQWRRVIGGAVLSLIYDAIWLYIRHSDLNVDKKGEEGNVEVSIKNFSLAMTYISLILKCIMIPVYWKISINFENFYEERSDLLNQNQY